MKALIDADILPYEFGGMKQLEEPDKPLAIEITLSLVDDRIKEIEAAVKATSKKLYLTDSKSNFRNRVATILPYKGGRKLEKPFHWEAIRQHLIDNYNAEVQYGIEADDRLSIEQMTGLNGLADDLESLDYTQDLQTVICSRDKDLHMTPGWHYSWACGKQKERLWFQDETSAIRCFYRQLLTGDRSTDNILGLFNVGASSRLVGVIDGLDDEQLMFNHVFKQYQDRFGFYAFQFIVENGILLWMMREEPKAYPERELELRFGKLVEGMLDE